MELCPSSPAGPSPRIYGEKDAEAAPLLPFSPLPTGRRWSEGPDEGQKSSRAIAPADTGQYALAFPQALQLCMRGMTLNKKA